MGHPVLWRPAGPVTDPAAAEIRRLAADMIETMDDAGGTGLAAPQVHVALRVVVFRVGAARAGEGGQAVPTTVLINPGIVVLGDETETAWEGCLSVPGLTGPVTRPAHIGYSGWGLDGSWIEREARGFHARVVQHECDHLDGILYPARMADVSALGFVEELRRAAQQGETA